MLTTWWVVLIGAAIAVALLFYRQALDYVAHLLLLVFIATTYLVAPVTGFAVTLIILGYACCPRDWFGIRLTYIACLFLVELYRDGDRDWRGRAHELDGFGAVPGSVTKHP